MVHNSLLLSIDYIYCDLLTADIGDDDVIKGNTAVGDFLSEEEEEEEEEEGWGYFWSF